MIGVTTIAVVLGFGMYQSNASQATPTLSPENIEELIAAQYPGEITAFELIQDNNGAIYAIEIEHEGKQYEVKVDGKSGEVLHLEEKIILADEQTDQQESTDSPERETTEQQEDEKEKNEVEKEQQQTKVEKRDTKEQQGEHKQDDRANDSKNHHAKKYDHQEHKNKYNNKHKHKNNYKNKQKEKSEDEQSRKTGIDVKQAIDIALAHFPGVVEEVELDENNGRLIYEIEIEADGEEAEFEIDAYTGEILIVEIDD